MLVTKKQDDDNFYDSLGKTVTEWVYPDNTEKKYYQPYVFVIVKQKSTQYIDS